MIYTAVKQNPYKPYIIFDLDGTLANIGHRLHHIQNDKPNWDVFNDACPGDAINTHVYELYQQMCNQSNKPNHPPIIVTARPETHREQTEQWLMKWNLVPRYLFMRPAKDYRPDVEIKKEIVDKYIQKAPVLFVVDDRTKVVNMWRELGYKCFQAQAGDY